MCLAYLSAPSLRTDTKATDAVVDDSIVEVDNLSAYLQKLRDMTRADDERTPLSLRTFDFRPMAEKTLRQLHIPDHKLVTFDTHFPPSLSVTADPMHLCNVLSNLLENAVKYSGDSVHITVSGMLDGHRFTLVVADNGIGIPPAEQARVFDKFYRVPTGNRHEVKGYGLGLFYVKTMVEKHGGTVEGKREPGKGSEFMIRI